MLLFDFRCYCRHGHRRLWDDVWTWDIDHTRGAHVFRFIVRTVDWKELWYAVCSGTVRHCDFIGQPLSALVCRIFAVICSGAWNCGCGTDTDQNKKAVLYFFGELSGEFCNSACNGAAYGLFLLWGAGLVNAYQFFCAADHWSTVVSWTSWRLCWVTVCPCGRDSFCALSLDFGILWEGVQAQCQFTGGCLDHGAAGLAETVAFLSDIGSRAFRNEKDEATAWICFHRLFYAACSIA